MKEQQTHTIQMQNGNTLKGYLLKTELLETPMKTVRLNRYYIEGYGEADYLETEFVKGADFRKVASMIPFEYIDKTAKDFQWGVYPVSEDVEELKRIVNLFVLEYTEFRKEGKGLYIFSKTKGSGKTFLSCCLANEIIKRYAVNVKFISSLDLLELTKKSYQRGEYVAADEVESIRKCGLLVLDDLGIEMPRDWVNTVLYQLINHRYTQKLLVIITSNMNIEALRIDDRIKDRLHSMCIESHIPEVAIRAEKSREQKNEFLTRISNKKGP